MKVSFNWLKDFSALEDINAEEVARTLSLKTAEVEGVEKRDSYLDEVVVVKVLGVRQHPNADKLSLVRFKYKGKDIEVVCGASNVREGMFALYAPVGVELPCGISLERRKIRGVYSEGMLCSEWELGIGEDKAGIVEINEAKWEGRSLGEYLGAGSDFVIEIDNKAITHRPDLWGHWGVAREVSAGYGIRFIDPFNSAWEKEKRKELLKGGSSPVSVSVQPSSGCYLYCGVALRGVEVKPSPFWLQQRLRTCGINPINNLVDIGNYVMLETGQPLHIFDLEKIRGSKLIIRCAEEGERLVILSGEVIELSKSDTVVADEGGALVLAGIIGGEESGVSSSTKDIFIEAANWHPSAIRKTSIRLGIRTESSQRFEKGLSNKSAFIGLARAVELVKELCPSALVVGKLERDGEDFEGEPKVISLTLKRVEELLGRKVNAKEVVDSLSSLGFLVKKEGSGGDISFSVVVPSFRGRSDIEGEQDLVEEIGRIIGYDTIDPVSIAFQALPKKLSVLRDVEKKVIDVLMQRGPSYQVMTYPVISNELLKKCKWPLKDEEKLYLKNPPSLERAVMRPSLVPGLIESISENQKYLDNFSLFEVGRVYYPCGKYQGGNWCTSLASEFEQVVFSFFSTERSLIGKALELALEAVGRVGRGVQVCSFSEARVRGGGESPIAGINFLWEGIHPFESEVLVGEEGSFLGIVFSLHPLVAREFDIKGNVAIGLIDFTNVLKEKERVIKYEGINKYPQVIFDCCVVVGKRVRAASVVNTVLNLGIPEISRCQVIDIYYPGNGEEKGLKHITLRVWFEDVEGTISEKRKEELSKLVVDGLERGGYPLRRE
ncbi:MAG: phenylalanine--tRNA ligase subunit beta [Candidatus Dadabacteria bacterium]|nr:MAG: phenylalanine--tRNA ligase subunit beta [Candidatus Dadabacteria bacterium]